MRGFWMMGLLPACFRQTNADSFQEFLAWLAGQGATYNAKFDIGTDSVTGLRGIVVQEPIANGTELFSMPSNLVFTKDFVQANGSSWQQCSASGRDGKSELLSPVHTSFALFLLEQSAPEAPWKPWISMLPESFEGFPLFYNDEELSGFQASPVRKVIELDQGAVRHDFETIQKVAPDVTYDKYRWARTAVKSRVFGLKSLAGGALKEEVIAMIPLADFVNHPPDNVVEANVAPSYNAETGRFRFAAVRDIKQSEGLYWDYGFRSNRNSLLRYGFTSQHRIALTDMPLFFQLSDFPGPPGSLKETKLNMIAEAQKKGALAMESDGTVFHELSLSLTGKPMERLMGHMRFMVFQSRNTSVLIDQCPDTYCGPISLQNERDALQNLLTILQSLIDQYKTSVPEDKHLIENGSLKPGQGAAWDTLMVRIGEKQILRGFTRLVQAVNPLFDLSPWALSAAVKDKWGESGSDIHRYVQQTVTSLVEQEGIRWAKRKLKEERKARTT